MCADKWSPALQIRTVLLSIQALLSAPNPDDPLANDVAELWKSNEAKAIENGMCKKEIVKPVYNGHCIDTPTSLTLRALRVQSTPLYNSIFLVLRVITTF